MCALLMVKQCFVYIHTHTERLNSYISHSSSYFFKFKQTLTCGCRCRRFFCVQPSQCEKRPRRHRHPIESSGCHVISQAIPTSISQRKTEKEKKKSLTGGSVLFTQEQHSREKSFLISKDEGNRRRKRASFIILTVAVGLLYI